MQVSYINTQLSQLIQYISDHHYGSIDEYAATLSQYERQALKSLIDKCRILTEMAED